MLSAGIYRNESIELIMKKEGLYASLFLLFALSILYKIQKKIKKMNLNLKKKIVKHKNIRKLGSIYISKLSIGKFMAF